MDSKIIVDYFKSFPSLIAALISNFKFKIPKHIQKIENEFLESLKSSKNIMINMPPRHGKSEFCSKYLPAYFLMKNPDKRVIFASYESSFAESWGRQVRDLINNWGKIYNVKINKNKKSASEFYMDEHGGAMYSIGAGGAITGRGANLLIIDDPIKNDAEANSYTYREKIWNWFKATIMTRVEPGGFIILIMTRWHEDDLCGRIQEMMKKNNELKDKWKLLSLPALDKKDKALWSERYSTEKLKEIRSSIGEYWFSALYQQRPSPAEGSIFRRKYFKHFKLDNNTISYGDEKCNLNNMNIYCTCDLASSLAESADYTVILVFAQNDKGRIFILDIIKEKIEGADHINLIKSVYDKWKPQLIGIETVQYQQSLLQIAIREGLPVKSLKADKDKFSRALPIAAKMESGLIYMHDNAHWLNDFENELLQFPRGKHDDQVDAFSYINEMIIPQGKFSPVSINKRKSVLKGW